MPESGFAKATAQAQQHVAEPVLAAAYFMPKGGFSRSAVVGGLQCGLIPALAAKAMKKRTEGSEPASANLPPQMVLAITDHDVFVLPVKSGFTTKIQPPVDTWSRSGMRVSVEKNKVTYSVRFELGDGRSVLTETKRLAANKPVAGVLRLLGASVPE